MLDFMYYNPVRVHFGRNALEELPGELAKFGSKVLLVYGGGSVKRTGLYDRILAALHGAGKEVFELPGVMPNPRTEKVYEGIGICKRENIDLILAVGGGSTIDSSKAIAAGVVYEGDFWDFYSGKRIEKALPVGTILTIAAAALIYGSSQRHSCL